MPAVDDALALFEPNSLSVRLLTAVVRVMPEASDYAHTHGPVEATSGFDSALGAALVEMGHLVDAADRRPLPAPPSPEARRAAQRDDAVLKALVLGWIARRIDGFAETTAGREMIAWWAAVEVVLPLGAVDVATLLAEGGAVQLNRMAALAGGEAWTAACADALLALRPTLQAAVDTAFTRIDALTLATAPHVPGLISAQDPSSELAVSDRADRMPIWVLLAARLAAECARR